MVAVMSPTALSTHHRSSSKAAAASAAAAENVKRYGYMPPLCRRRGAVKIARVVVFIDREFKLLKPKFAIAPVTFYRIPLRTPYGGITHQDPKQVRLVERCFIFQASGCVHSKTVRPIPEIISIIRLC